MTDTDTDKRRSVSFLLSVNVKLINYQNIEQGIKGALHKLHT